MSVEITVVLLYLFLLFRGEPTTLAGQQFRLQLGIELGIIGTGTIYFLLHLHTKKTSASRGVGQQLLLIACANEGSDSRQLAIIRPVRLSESQLLELHQVLQGRHASYTIAVEFIHIDKTEEREFLLASAYTGDVELVDIEALQFFRQQNGTKR